MRWIASLVAETHRILMRGGVFLYPRDTQGRRARPGRLRLLYECNPIGMIVEQAGGRASTGERPVLEVAARRRSTSASASCSGRADEVERIERYHAEHCRSRAPSTARRPLFNAARPVPRTP